MTREEECVGKRLMVMNVAGQHRESKSEAKVDRLHKFPEKGLSGKRHNTRLLGGD